MADISMNGSNDLQVSMGDLVIIGGNNDIYDIVQQSINSVMTVQGELEYHTSYGNTIFNERKKMSDTGLLYIASACKSAIMMGDARVKSVDNIVAERVEDKDYTCKVKYTLTSIYGDTMSSSTIITL